MQSLWQVTVRRLTTALVLILFLTVVPGAPLLAHGPIAGDAFVSLGGGFHLDTLHGDPGYLLEASVPAMLTQEWFAGPILSYGGVSGRERMMAGLELGRLGDAVLGLDMQAIWGVQGRTDKGLSLGLFAGGPGIFIAVRPWLTFDGDRGLDLSVFIKVPIAMANLAKR